MRGALMSKEEAVQFVSDKLKDSINTFWETGSMRHVTHEDQKNVKRLWETVLFPGNTFDTGCGSCMAMGYDTIGSWYIREKKKLDAAAIATLTEEDKQRVAEAADDFKDHVKESNPNRLT